MARIILLLEDTEKSNSAVTARQPHFPILPTLRDLSYAERYAHFCTQLVRERLYDAACLILAGSGGAYRELSAEIDFDTFLNSLAGSIYAARRRISEDPSTG